MLNHYSIIYYVQGYEAAMVVQSWNQTLIITGLRTRPMLGTGNEMMARDCINVHIVHNKNSILKEFKTIMLEPISVGVEAGKRKKVTLLRKYTLCVHTYMHACM